MKIKTRKREKNRLNKYGGSKKKFKKRNNSKKKSKRGGGQVWKTYKEVADPAEYCSICHETYVDTPTQAIYKTWCGHLFHNDCLNSYCDINGETTKCPLCRKPIQDIGHQNCMDVWAFKTKSLSEDNIDLQPEDMAKIYNDQIIL